MRRGGGGELLGELSVDLCPALPPRCSEGGEDEPHTVIALSAYVLQNRIQYFVVVDLVR